MRPLVGLFLAALTGSASAQAPEVVAEFGAGMVTVAAAEYPYRLLEPPAEVRHEELPLVVFLHGAGERGDDNDKQLTWLPNVLARPDWRTRHPCYVLAVQCPADERWVDAPWEDPGRPMAAEPARPLQAVVKALDEVLARHRVDRARVYLTGLSMGGYGTWDLAARQPDRFAAAMPVCGGGDPAIAGRLVGLPIAVYHGADDPVVPVAGSRTMVAALRGFGEQVEYHELALVKHDAWRQAYGDGGGLDWLFAQDQRQQRRGAFATFAVVPSPADERYEPGSFMLAAGARCVVPAEARAAGELFRRGLLLETGRQLPVVEGGPTPGDVVLVLDTAVDAEVVVAIGDSLEVRAATVQALSRGAAVAVQVLATWPGLCCPRGQLTMAPAVGGRVVVDTAAEPWSGAALMRLCRLAWLFGANEICGDGFAALSGFDAATRASVQQEAALFGVTLTSQPAETAAVAVVFASARSLEIGQVLTWPCDTPCFFEVRLPPGAVRESLARLMGLLPAASERATWPGRRLARGPLMSRVGALLRHSSLR